MANFDQSSEFNRAQRAHQNTLEQLPFVIPNLLLGGLRHPILATAAGCVWMAGRYVKSMLVPTRFPLHLG